MGYASGFHRAWLRSYRTVSGAIVATKTALLASQLEAWRYSTLPPARMCDRYASASRLGA